MIYLFTYDLHPSLFRNIQPIILELQKSPAWNNCLERTWLIGTYEDINQLNQRIAKHLKKTDHWLIVQITPVYQGWLPPGAWNWIRDTADKMGI